MGQLNEQHFITDFISKVFNAIVAGRNQALDKAMRKDPAFQKIVRDVEQSRQEMRDWIANRLKQDPALARRYKKIRNL